MMPQAIDIAIREMCADAMQQTVIALSAKYGFDPDEARRFITNDEIKLVRKRGPSPTEVKRGTGDKTKTKTKTNNVVKSKRAPTGYLIFGKEMRPLVKSELQAALGDDEKLTPQAVVTEIASRWQALGDEGKAEWNSKAKTPDVSGESEQEPEQEFQLDEELQMEIEVPEEEPVQEPVKEKKKKEKKKKEKKVESDTE